mgnify:CR=1 FL=1
MAHPLQQIHVGVDGVQQIYLMEKITSIRAVYLLMSLVLLLALWLQEWLIVAFVIVMLQFGVWLKACPSKWLFERLGFKKSEL